MHNMLENIICLDKVHNVYKGGYLREQIICDEKQLGNHGQFKYEHQ